jgi:selenocysteine lyase/cysteine desulfurase
MADDLSSGITCFEIDGMVPDKIVERLFEKRIIASDSPYATSYARLTPGLLNTPEEVDRAVAAVKALAACGGQAVASSPRAPAEPRPTRSPSGHG